MISKPRFSQPVNKLLSFANEDLYKQVVSRNIRRPIKTEL